LKIACQWVSSVVIKKILIIAIPRVIEELKGEQIMQIRNFSETLYDVLIS
jgi:hypothetical protein